MLFRSFKNIFKHRLRLLGRTPPPLEYELEEEQVEKGAEVEVHGSKLADSEKEEPRSAAESEDRSSKGVYYNANYFQ